MDVINEVSKEKVVGNEYKDQGMCFCGFPCSEFKKIMTSKQGLIVYVFTKECPVCGEKETAGKEKHKDTDISVQADNTVIVIRNTKDNDNIVEQADFVPEFDIKTVKCPRCRHKMNQARKLLATVPLVEKKDILSVCDFCALKQIARAPCHICQKAIRQFSDTETENFTLAENIQKKILNYLTNAESILKTAIISKEGKITRSFSHGNITKILERRDEYSKRLSRPKSGPVFDTTLQYKWNLEPLNIIVPEKKVKITIKTQPDTTLETKMRQQYLPISTKIPKYFRGDFAKAIKSDTVLGVGTTGILRRSHSDDSMLTSFTGIKDDIFRRNLKYLFPRSVKKEFDALKTSEDLIKETRERFQEEKEREAESKKKKQDEIRKRKLQQKQEKEIYKAELQRKIELAKRQGIIPLDDTKPYKIDKKTGLLVEIKRPDRAKKNGKPLKGFKKGEKRQKLEFDEKGREIQSYKRVRLFDEKGKEKRGRKKEKLFFYEKGKEKRGIKNGKLLDDTGKVKRGKKKGTAVEGEGTESEKQKNKDTQSSMPTVAFRGKDVGDKLMGMLIRGEIGRSTEDGSKKEKVTKRSRTSIITTPKSKSAITMTSKSAAKMSDAQSGRSSELITEEDLLDDNEIRRKIKVREQELKKIKSSKGDQAKKSTKGDQAKVKTVGKRVAASDDEVGEFDEVDEDDEMYQERVKGAKGHFQLLDKVLSKQDRILEKHEKLRLAQHTKLDKIKQLASKKGQRLDSSAIKLLEVDLKKSPRPSLKEGEEGKKEVKGKPKVEIDDVKVTVSGDDLVLRLISLYKKKDRRLDTDFNQPIPALPTIKRKVYRQIVSQTEEDKEEDMDTVSEIEPQPEPEYVHGNKVVKMKGVPAEKKLLNQPTLFQKVFHKPQGEPSPSPASSEAVLPTGPGAFRYALSDRSYIAKGWTKLPEEKIIRKMNIYNVKPVKPEFDWFKHNKHKGVLTYTSGEKMAAIDDTGHGRWYYKNSRLALDYYECAEANAQQRYVIYSSGEPDSKGRSQPITVLGMFDYNGSGVVFDHQGKIRLKYNQSEGVLLDRSLGPSTHWKWHSLNDPPVLQQVMIDTKLTYKDPDLLAITEMEQEPDKKVADEEMLEIEFENFAKTKNITPAKKFQPHQIKMKALKINDQFSLKILDQTRIYLHFREGSQKMKVNLGMELDHTHIIDTAACELGEVSLSMETRPAVTESIVNLQNRLAMAQKVNRVREEREAWRRPPGPSASADGLTTALSRSHRSPLLNADGPEYKYTSNNLYYNTRLI